MPNTNRTYTSKAGKTFSHVLDAAAHDAAIYRLAVAYGVTQEEIIEKYGDLSARELSVRAGVHLTYRSSGTRPTTSA